MSIGPNECGNCGAHYGVHKDRCPFCTADVDIDIPVVGSINEPRLEAQGWRVVRDRHTGLALYKQRIHPRETA